MVKEIPLVGGQSTPGVVRLGNTVRRPLSAGWEFRHELLRQLEAHGFTQAPRLLGIDDQGREILSFLEGATIRAGEVPLGEIGAMVAAFHDATAGTPLAAGREVVCHGDIAPWNTIHHQGQLIGLIDFDAAEPGDRMVDLAYAAWTFLDIGTAEPAVIESGLREFFEGYGRMDRTGLAEAILRQQQQVLTWRQQMATTAADPALREMSRERTVLIPRHMEWVRTHRALIDAAG